MRRVRFLVGLLLLTVTMVAQNKSEYTKLSPWLRSQVIQENSDPVRRGAAVDRQIEVLVKLAADADETRLFSRYDAELLQRIGQVLIVRLPILQVAALAADEQVVRVEAERMPRPLLDMMPGQIGADKAASNADSKLPQAYTGKGVIVGIVDAGFDYVNPFFRDANGTTRIKWVNDYPLNQKLTTSEDIVNAKHSSDAATMLHGTHVAGIAAGSVVNDINDVFYNGIAREADIAEAAINAMVVDASVSSASALRAFSDLFAYAKDEGKPCVINYSMGDALSFANSRQLEEESLKTLLNEPGRAIVVASGNSGGTARLAHKDAVSEQGGVGVRFNNYETYGTYFGIEVKVKPTQTIKLRYMDSSYKISKGEVSHTAKELETISRMQISSMKSIRVDLREKSDDGSEIFYLTAGNSTFSTDDRLLITISGEGEAWIYADIMCAGLENVATQPDHSLAIEGYSVAWPACLDDVIAVGNTAHRFQIMTAASKYSGQGPLDLTADESTKGVGYLAKSSSVGPTLDGRCKPDVCAPGVNIVSAYNNFTNESTDYDYAYYLVGILDTEYEEDNGGYFATLALTGTSMSSPAVAGTVALWMEADPTLTTEKIKDIIAHSSRQPDAELSYPNSQYGYGEIDAYKGLLYINNLLGIEEISDHQPANANILLDGRQLTVKFAHDHQGPVTIRIYATDGRQLLQTAETSVNLSTLPAGVYAVQVTTDRRETTGSTLIRL